MNRLRSIFLSGLVALLMVGMVSAGDVSQIPGNDELNAGINIYFGTLNADKTSCLPIGGAQCINIGISFDLQWLKQLFN